MHRRFIVLRDRSPAPERRHRGDARAVFDPDAIEASREEYTGLSPDLDDDSILGWAPAMPMALVTPLDAAGAAAGAGREAWGVRAVRADASKCDGQGVSVAVLDTGIDAAHPAFAHFRDRKLEQRDFTGEGDGDLDGHGTHCAGTIFGQDVDGTRIGIAPGVRAAYIAKVLDRHGHGTSDGLVQALMWAAEKRAQVITLSLGIDYPGYVKQLIETEDLPPQFSAWRALDAFRATVLVFEQVIELLRKMVKNVVVIAAAGNESARERRADYTMGVSVPAVTQGVISVGALGNSDTGLAVAPFSNTRPVVCAPGVDILSASCGGGLRRMSGTSMAAPHVAGVAALWAQQLRAGDSRSTLELRSRVVTSVTSEGFAPGFSAEDVGAGLVVAP